MNARTIIALAVIANFYASISNAFVHFTIDSRQQPLPRVDTKAASTSNEQDAKPPGFWDRLETVLFAPLEIKTDETNADIEDPRLLLAEWKNMWEETIQLSENEEILNRNATAAAIAAEESLANFLEVWARITLPNDKGLTTPVSPTKFKTNPPEVNTTDIHYQTNNSMKLIFRPPKRYLSYKEQKGMEKNGVIPDRKGAKVDAWSPGGVEVEVTMTVTRFSNEEKSILSASARRCNIDGDTVIKKTSERAIVRRLENAIRIWKKSNPDDKNNR